MSEVDKIYSRYLTCHEKDTRVRIFEYEWALISIYDSGRPIIRMDIRHHNMTPLFIESAAKYLMTYYSGVNVEPTVSVTTSGLTAIKIDYAPEMKCRNFWKVDNVVEEAKHFVRVINGLYEVFNAGVSQEQSKKENKNMPTKKLVNVGDGTLYYYDKYSDSWKPLSLDTAIGTDATMTPVINLSGIEKVIYNDPATIIFWKDHTKTIAKCSGGDKYDPLKGFMLCVMRKMINSQTICNNFIKEWCPEDIFEAMKNTKGVKFTQTTITKDYISGKAKKGN